MIKQFLVTGFWVIVAVTVIYTYFYTPYSNGDCVLVSSNDSSSTGKGEYIKYADQTHWITRGGKVFGLKADRNSITLCD